MRNRGPAQPPGSLCGANFLICVMRLQPPTAPLPWAGQHRNTWPAAAKPAHERSGRASATSLAGNVLIEETPGPVVIGAPYRLCAQKHPQIWK